jgi:hypothetical protein
LPDRFTQPAHTQPIADALGLMLCQEVAVMRDLGIDVNKALLEQRLEVIRLLQLLNCEPER